MDKLIELCDLNNRYERNFCFKLLASGFENTMPAFRNGNYYFNYIDSSKFITSFDICVNLPRFLKKKIIVLRKQIKYKFTKIALINSEGRGSFDLLPFYGNFVVDYPDLNFITVMPNRKSIRKKIKGDLSESDVVLLLTAVSETGLTIAQVANIIWGQGAKMPCAFSLIDRGLGASGNLAMKDVQLYSLFSLKTLLEKKGDKFVKKHGYLINPNFEYEQKLFENV